MTNTNENAASGCKACDGEGAIHTGIEEFPETWCESCKGTGTVQAPQAATTASENEAAALGPQVWSKEAEMTESWVNAFASREAAPMDERALVQARDALNGLLWQFTSTPSTLKDSNARAQGHAAIKAIDAALAQHSAEPAPSAPAAVTQIHSLDALTERLKIATLVGERITLDHHQAGIIAAALAAQPAAAKVGAAGVPEGGVK